MLGKYDLSLSFIKKSRIYAQISEDIILANWCYSYIYYKMNNIKDSIKYIEIAIHECLIIETENLLYGALVHKALLTNDENLMIESLNNLGKYDLTDEVLDEYYTDLFMLYLNNNNIFMAKKVLHSNIKTNVVKQKLNEKISKCINNI
jgi:hypothetical protein